MTISSTNRRAGPYSGNGSQTAFPFSFKVFEASDMLVVKGNVSASSEVTLTLNTDFTVTLNPDQNSNAGGTVTLVTALPTGFNLVLSSKVAYLQETDLTNQGGFYPEVITDALDRLTIEAQQLKEEIDRSARLPITSTISTDQLVSDILKIADHATELDTVANNIADVTATAAHMAEIVAAPTYAASAAADAASALSSKNAAAASQSAASASASAASGYASSAAASAVHAENAVAAANIPPSLAGQANKFLQVKDDETGYELVSSVAAPAFYGFKLSNDLSSLDMTYGRDDYNVEDFATWTMSENVTFRVRNNNLEMVL